MTSLDVAPLATSSRISVEVIKRESLWRGGIVEIKIPLVCREGMTNDLHFIQFARTVKGGLINFFVRDENPIQHCGRTITAEAEILRKEYADGRSFVYVDLRPAPDKAATLRLIVEQKLNLSVPRNEVLFAAQTTLPLEGIVVISTRKAAPKQRISTTGDSQLDRLLADGWVVTAESASEVYLRKGERGSLGERKLIHHRPKKKK